MFNEFAIISDKYKVERKVNYNIIFNNLISSIIDMFEFTGFPESVRPDMLMRYLWCNGVAAIPLDIDKPPVCICSLGGEVDAYGYGTEVNYNAQSGKISGTGKIGENIALFKNNTYMYPEFYILQTAKLLCEVRTSLNANIINSRLAPFGKARSDAEKTEIEKAFNDVYKGKPFVIKLDRGPFDTESARTQEKITESLTQVSDSAYIPYLSQVEDDIIQKFYYHYGLNLKDVNKRSQVTTEELQGADSLVWTVPLMHLRELKKGCEMMRKKYPDADVKFGSVWAKEYENYIKESANDDNNNENSYAGDNSENPADERNNDHAVESEQLRPGDNPSAGE